MPRKRRGKAERWARTLKRGFTSVLKHAAARELIVCGLIIAALYFGVQGFLILVLRTDSPLLAVESDSMKPTFERGDLLIIRGVNPLEDVEIRDIIVFQKGQRTIVHRVIRIDENGMFVTRGDANPEYQTESVRPEEVRGEVVFVIPNLGHISLWVRGR